jgi:hypothetical protein
MRQVFFISPNGYMPVRTAFDPPVNGARTHGWCAEGDDPSQGTVIGVVEMNGLCDSEEVITAFESQGIMWLPNHKNNEQIKPEHYQALKRHGVQPNHTTAEAMKQVHSIAGFPPIKPKRF